MNIEDVLQNELKERQAQSLYRKRHVLEKSNKVRARVAGRNLLSFCSNDYLGLAEHPKVIEAFTAAAKKYGVGAKAADLVCGHSAEHKLLEEALAEYTGRPRAVLFSTGYMANMGTINALARSGDVVFQDKLNHASLVDGGLLSSADFCRYKHNDMTHLSFQLEKYAGKRKLIVVDGVFSMDGVFADLPALITLAKKHGAWLMVDDAHGIGCAGPNGKGTLDHFSVSSDSVPILVGTFGKALGTFGAFVAGSEALIEALIQFSRTYIYTTAIPPAVAAATRASLQILSEEPERREHLNRLVAAFREQCEAFGLKLTKSTTAIQPVLVGTSGDALAMSKKLEERGYWVSAIRPPSVPVGTSRLRVTLCADHTLAQVESFVEVLAEVYSGFC